MKSTLPLLACLSLVPASLTAPAQDPPTPRPAAPASDLDVGIPWLPPAASLDEYLLQLDLRRLLKRREKLLQLIDELELEIALAEAMDQKPTDEQRAALDARNRVVREMFYKITSKLRETDSQLREYQIKKEMIEKERAENPRR
jgi:hypothetical protein